MTTDSFNSDALLTRRTAELHQAERRWRSLLEDIGLAVVGLDIDGKISYANPFLLKLTGYTAEEIAGRDWFADFVPPSEHAQLSQYFKDLLTRPETPLQYRNTVRGRSAQEYVFRWNHTLLRDPDGNCIGTISIGENITEQAKFDRIKDDFISVVSHELRTPLTAIHGGINLLSQGSVSSQSELGQQLLGVVAENSQRLVRLVNDIIDVEYLSSAKNPLRKELINTQEITHVAVSMFKCAANQSNREVIVRDSGFDIVGDRDRLSQVLTHLLENAAKFSPPESTVRLTVKSHPQAAEKAAVLFTLCDQGRGIPPEQRSKIFERFTQVDASNTRTEGGTGLGLAICQSIVNLHGGRIWVESHLGQGSCFHFTIPAV